MTTPLHFPRLFAAAMTLFCSTFVFAAPPTITSITPAAGPTAGGTQVTITGTGFSSECEPHFNCGYPKVFFGIAQAASVQMVSETTLIATTPKYLPGTVGVGVSNALESSARQLPFTFNGPVPETFVRFLLPTFTEPVHGAQGSEFHTQLRARVSGPNVDPVHVFGVHEDCLFVCIAGEMDPLWLTHDDPLEPQDVSYDGRPARFVYVPAGEVSSFTANLRVFDVSRDADNYGTEMPIVHQREFTEEQLAMLGVPSDPRFRNTLRVYNVRFLPMVVTMSINDVEAARIVVPAAMNIFNPGVAVYSDFPQNVGPMTVTIDQPAAHNDTEFREPVWAFITVTNNETQLITTVTPRVY
jgi:hypothetical protein